jgi:hypothetical protein
MLNVVAPCQEKTL